MNRLPLSTPEALIYKNETFTNEIDLSIDESNNQVIISSLIPTIACI